MNKTYKVELAPQEHWREGMKRYAVRYEGKEIGTVEQTEATSHRKAGRLIVRTYRSVEWEYRVKDDHRYHGLSYKTRKEALIRLLEQSGVAKYVSMFDKIEVKTVKV